MTDFLTNFTCEKKKEDIWLSPMAKSLKQTEMSYLQSDNTKNATKKVDYTAIADRLRTVSWRKYSNRLHYWIFSMNTAKKNLKLSQNFNLV